MYWWLLAEPGQQFLRPGQMGWSALHLVPAETLFLQATER
jgi:hypothetical protein